MGAGQRLEEVVMGVDEAGQDDMARGVELRVVHGMPGSAPLPTSSATCAVLDDDAPLGTFGENRDRIPDPHSPPMRPPAPLQPP